MKPINIDASPIPIQGPGAESVGKPFQYTPLDFTIPFRAQQMAMQQQSDLANLAMRQKELELREKTLEYQMTSDARKEYLAMMDNVFGAIQSGGVGGGGRTAQGGAPADDFGIFNQSQAAMDWQAMQSEIAMSVLDSLPHNFNTPQDYRGATDILAKKTQELYKQQMQMRRDNPHLIQMQELNRKHNLWMEQQKKADEKNVLRHSGNLQLISDKIAEINQLDSKDPLIQEKLQELDYLYTNKSSVVNASSFNEYIKDAGDNYAEGIVTSSITTMDGYQVLVDTKLQEDPDVRARVLAVNAITNPDFREVFKAKGWISDNDIANIDEILSLTRRGPNGEDPQYTPDEAIQIIEQEGLLGNVKNVISSSLASNVKSVGGETSSKVTQVLNQGKKATTTSSEEAETKDRADWNKMGLDIYSKGSDALAMWGYGYKFVKDGKLSEEDMYILADEYQRLQEQYDKEFEAWNNQQNLEKGDAPTKPPTMDKYLSDYVKGKIEAQERIKQEAYEYDVNIPYDYTPDQDISNKIESGYNNADNKDIVFSSETYGDYTDQQLYDEIVRTNVWGSDESGRRRGNLYEYMSEVGYKFRTGDKVRTVRPSQADMETWKKESGYKPYVVTQDVNGRFSGGLYQFNGTNLYNMIGTFAEGLESSPGSNEMTQRINGVVEKDNAGNYRLSESFRQGKTTSEIQRELQGLMAEMSLFDGARMVAHQKVFFEDKYLKPNAKLFDRGISNNGNITYVPDGYNAPESLSSRTPGLDFLFHSTITNSSPQGLERILSSYRAKVAVKDNVPPLEAMRFFTEARVEYGVPFVLGGRYATSIINNLPNQKLQEFLKEKGVGLGLIRSKISSMQGGWQMNSDDIKALKSANITDEDIKSLIGNIDIDKQKQINKNAYDFANSWMNRVNDDGVVAGKIYKNAYRSDIYTNPKDAPQQTPTTTTGGTPPPGPTAGGEVGAEEEIVVPYDSTTTQSPVDVFEKDVFENNTEEQTQTPNTPSYPQERQPGNDMRLKPISPGWKTKWNDTEYREEQAPNTPSYPQERQPGNDIVINNSTAPIETPAEPETPNEILNFLDGDYNLPEDEVGLFLKPGQSVSYEGSGISVDLSRQENGTYVLNGKVVTYKQVADEMNKLRAQFKRGQTNK